MADSPTDRRRVSEAAKKTAAVRVRLSRAQAAAVEARAAQHDPPTVAAWIRDLIARDLRGGDRRRPG